MWDHVSSAAEPERRPAGTLDGLMLQRGSCDDGSDLDGYPMKSQRKNEGDSA